MLKSVLSILILSIITIEKDSTLLNVFISANSPRVFEELGELMKEITIGEYVEIFYKKCLQFQQCPRFTVEDPFGIVLEEYYGIFSSRRYLQIIKRHIKDSKYPLKQRKKEIGKNQHIEGLMNQELSLRIYEARRKLVQSEKMEDWEKASYPRKKTDITHKDNQKVLKQKQPTALTKKKNLKEQNQKYTESSKTSLQYQSAKSNGSTKNISNKEPQTQENFFAWKFGYIIIIIALIFGMKYLSKQQKRITKITHPHSGQRLGQQGDSLANN